MKEPDLMEDCVVMVTLCAMLFIILSFHLLNDMKEEKIKTKASAIQRVVEKLC